MRQFFSRRVRQGTHATLLLLCGLLALALPLGLAWRWPDFLEPVELWTVDLRFRLRPPLAVAGDPAQAVSTQIAVIDYDDQAALEYGLGRWPWDRRVHAQVLDWLHAAGAKAVLMDLLFDRASHDAAEDRALVEATRRAGMVVYPAVFRSGSAEDSRLVVPAAVARHLVQRSGQTWPVPNRLPGVQDAAWPFEKLLAVAGGLGHIQRTPDRDGALRRIPLVYAIPGGYVPSLSFAAALRMLGADPVSVKIEPGRQISFTTGNTTASVPVDAAGRAWINYAGLWGKRFPHYPYSWLRNQMEQPGGRGQLPEWFGGRAVVLDNLTTGNGDQGATPFERDFPFGEVHAHLVSMFLTKQFLRDAHPTETVAVTLLPTIGLVGAAMLGGVTLILPAYVTLLGALLLAAYLAFAGGGVILPVVTPALALSLTLVFVLAARFFIVDRERLRFLSMLGAMLPPHTIRVVQESPERMAQLMAGRRKELTILFADLQGFTEFCRKADAAAVQQLLREYRTVLTDILRAHGGTLEKYTGDEVMAFFGDAEPEDGNEQEEYARVARHAANAVRAGLAIQQAMQRLNERWRAQGWEAHLVRVGLNTGHVTVGNFGTDKLWQYCVVGSEVNKGKRLEGAAPPGGLALAPRTYMLARAQEVLATDLSPTRVLLKGFGGEEEIYLLTKEMVMT
jgi:adenylate cyclase